MAEKFTLILSARRVYEPKDEKELVGGNGAFGFPVRLPVLLQSASKVDSSLLTRKHKVGNELHDLSRPDFCKICARIAEPYEIVRVGPDGKEIETDPVLSDKHLIGLGSIKQKEGPSQEFFHDSYYMYPDPEQPDRLALAFSRFRAKLKREKLLYIVSICFAKGNPPRRAILDPRGKDTFLLHRMKLAGEFQEAPTSVWDNIVSRTNKQEEQILARQLDQVIQPYDLDEAALLSHPVRESERLQIDRSLNRSLRKRPVKKGRKALAKSRS